MQAFNSLPIIYLETVGYLGRDKHVDEMARLVLRTLLVTFKAEIINTNLNVPTDSLIHFPKVYLVFFG